jgi:hypothetical protein
MCLEWFNAICRMGTWAACVWIEIRKFFKAANEKDLTTIQPVYSKTKTFATLKDLIFGGML